VPAASEPLHLDAPRASPFQTAKRAFASFRAHDMTDHGAALTYYLVMSLFPALLVGISLFGLVASTDTVVNATSYLRDAGAPQTAVTAVHDALANLVKSSGGKAGTALILGSVIGLNSASGAFGAAGRALNVAFAVDEDRGFVRRKLVDVGCTLLIIVLSLIALIAVLLGGQVAHDLLGAIGLGSTGATIFSIARWPLAVAAMMASFAIVYGFAPDRRSRPFRWISPGAVVGVLIWIVASLAFFVYVANFGKYGATYGAFAGAVILLLWLYISSLAFLFGGELNAEIERAETAGRSGPPFVSPPPSPEHPIPVAAQPTPAREATS
jgi:membrane protein